MKNGSKPSQKQAGSPSGVLGKRDAPEGKNGAKTGADNGAAAASTSKDMEAELLRLMRENDKLKNQLSDSQGEVNWKALMSELWVMFEFWARCYRKPRCSLGQAPKRSH
jgi:hypothetical protein